MARPKKHTPETGSPPKVGRLRLGPQGRLTLPPALRRALGVRAGQELVASLEDGALVLRAEDDALARLQARWAKAAPERTGELLSDELIRERREEAAREARD